VEPTEDLRKAFGRAVRTLRTERGWTQEQLADAAALHMTYISDLERGARSPGLTIQARLAEALDTTIADLFRTAGL
jgi:transcriptional regulator with XRE-family HTH domain